MYRKTTTICFFILFILVTLSAFGEGRWTVYTSRDGLANDDVNTIFEDSQGSIWFGTKGGISNFDGIGGWKTYTTADGLSSNNVCSISEDDTGNLWLAHATDVGVTKYDGSKWWTYDIADGLVSNTINVIYRDRYGNMWFGTSGGISAYDGTRWRSYTTADGLSSNIVNSIYEDNQGSLWFATRTGASRYDGLSFSTLLPEYSISSIIEDDDGNTWFGTGGGAWKFDGVSWAQYAVYEDNLLNLPPEELEEKTIWGVPDNIEAISKDSIGNLYFIHPYFDMILPGISPEASDPGVTVFNGTTWGAITVRDGLATNAVRTILEDSHGNLWFGHATRMDITGDPLGDDYGVGVGGGVSMREFALQFSRRTRDDGLSSDTVTTIFKDSSGNMWLGHGGTTPVTTHHITEG